MENNLKKMTLAYATLTSFVILLSQSFVKGIWTIYPLAIAIWLSWMGIYMSQRASFPKGLRIVFMVTGLSLVVMNLIGVLMPINVEVLQWSVCGYVLIGMSVGNRYTSKERQLSEVIVLNFIFAMLYAAIVLLEQRSIVAGLDMENDFFAFEHRLLAVTKYILMMCVLYYFFQMMAHPRIQAIKCSRMRKALYIILCLGASFVLLVKFSRFPESFVLGLLTSPMIGCLSIMLTNWCCKRAALHNHSN